jgi:hypothetical protein
MAASQPPFSTPIPPLSCPGSFYPHVFRRDFACPRHFRLPEGMNERPGGLELQNRSRDHLRFASEAGLPAFPQFQGFCRHQIVWVDHRLLRQSAPYIRRGSGDEQGVTKLRIHWGGPKTMRNRPGPPESPVSLSRLRSAARIGHRERTAGSRVAKRAGEVNRITS